MVGAVYDRGYRGYEGDARRAQPPPARRCSCASVRRALGHPAPVAPEGRAGVLLGIATVPAIVFVGVGYVTRDTPGVRLRVDHLPRVRRRLDATCSLFVALTAPDIMCPDRRQRVLPLLFARPLTGADYVLAKVGAMFALVFAFGVPAAGGAVPRPDARERRRRPPLRPRQRRGALAGPGGGRACWRSTTRSISVAISSLTSRRIIAGAAIIGAAPHLGHRERDPRRGGEEVDVRGASVAGPPSTVVTEDGEVIVVPERRRGRVRRRRRVVDATRPTAALVNLLTLPLVVRDLVFLGEVEAGHPLSGLANSGLYALLVFAGRADRRASRSSSGATTRSSGDRHRSASRRRLRRRPRRSTRRSWPTPTVVASDVSVWFGQKVALSELSCCFGAGVTGLLGPNGAGKTTLMRAITGLIPVNQGSVVVDGRSPRARPLGVRAAGPRARGRGGAPRPVAPPAVHLRGRPARHHRPPDRRLGARHRGDAGGRPTGAWTASARACGSAARWPPPS